MPHRISGRRRLVRFLPLVCLSAAVWSVAVERADAQFNMSDYLSRMDANGNGLLEPSEMSERFQSFWGAQLKERGIDTSRPIPMDRLKPIMEERFERMRRDRESSGSSSRFGSRGGDDRSRGSDRGRDEGRGSSGRDDRGSSSSSKAAQPLLVPGFGNDFEPLPVPGFEGLAEAEDNWESQFDRRTLEMVDDMLRRYDRDRSGVLERSEWANGQWRTDPASSDLDNDGRLTRKELAMRVASSSSRSSEGGGDSDRGRPSFGSRDGGDRGRPSFGSREGGDRGPGGWGGPPRDGDGGRGGWSRGGDGGGWSRGGDGGGWFGSRDGGEPPAEPRPSSTTSSSKTPTVTSYRFKTPTERLPKGMPEWFARLDINADGQISMAEFTSDWSVQQVAEFRSWDHNGDGIITPNECLAGQQSVETVASTSSAGPAPESMAQANAGGSGPPSAGPPAGGPSRFGSGGSSSSGRSGFGPPGGSRSTGATPSGFGRSSGSPGGPAAGPPSSSAPPTTTASASSSAPSNFSAGASNRYREIYTQKFREWDVNRNGVLDADEINPSVKSADTNGDGRITLDELLNRFAQPR